nr:SPOR domain-containing protein [Deinococcus sp. JMULE3]
MIGALVLLLLGGFGTLLLRPQAGTPVSAAADSGTDAPATDTTTLDSVPGAPGSTESTDAATAPVSTTEITAPTGQDSVTSPGSDAPQADGSANPGSVPSTDGADTPVIAAAPIGTPDPTLTDTQTAPQTEDADPASADPASDTPATDPAAPAARTGGAVPTSEQRTPLRSDYRITLGTFGSDAAAQSATQGVGALGYTVYPITVAAGVVAQVGPFADEATAREALADVQRAYPGAVLYPPRDRSLSTPSTPATTGATAETAQTTPAEPATPAPTATTPTYLQVGAFDRLESAQNLVQQLRDLGYNPTVNAPAGKKVTVLVGPYTGDPLTRTETRLQENGLDSFRVR